MAGYANSKSKTVSSINGYRADGSVNGYSTGVYGTWNANNVDKTGAYLGTGTVQLV
nr:autotransporter outer membrane beta-barrel domain-containing protein [Klebsiella pneumoniae]